MMIFAASFSSSSLGPGKEGRGTAPVPMPRSSTLTNWIAVTFFSFFPSFFSSEKFFSFFPPSLGCCRSAIRGIARPQRCATSFILAFQLPSPLHTFLHERSKTRLKRTAPTRRRSRLRSSQVRCVSLCVLLLSMEGNAGGPVQRGAGVWALPRTARSSTHVPLLSCNKRRHVPVIDGLLRVRRSSRDRHVGLPQDPRPVVYPEG